MAIFSKLWKVVFYVPHLMSYFFSIFQKKKKRNETFGIKLFIFSTLCSKHSVQFFHTMDNLKLFPKCEQKILTIYLQFKIISLESVSHASR